jgi:uncharacterized membrane protein YgcG
MWWSRRREERRLADAREEALRWYERLGGQVMNLPPGDSPATKQALVDAGERYTAAGAQLERSTSVAQYQLARETALEGLAYVRAARISLGFDPGPPLPPLASQRESGAIRQQREVQVGERSYRASPQAGDQTPYYYPGGRIGGRPVPSGWYSEPWWKTALVAGAWGIGGAMVFDALLAPAWGDYGAGYGGFDQGYDQGFEQGFAAGDNQGYDQGYDQGYQAGDDNNNDYGNNDQNYGDYQADPGYDGGNDPNYGGDFNPGGGYDGGGYDSGGFDGGGFDGGGDFGGGGGFDF